MKNYNSPYQTFWSSCTVQDGIGKDLPYEQILRYKNLGTSDKIAKVCVQKVSGVSKILEVFIQPEDEGVLVYGNNINATDSVIGHAASPSVIAVGAVNWTQKDGPIEPYSSRGPSTINFPSTQIRSKPDIIGIDNVSTNAVPYGGYFSPFTGTSASNPHIAGIIADVWSSFPSRTAQEMKTSLYNSAIDLGSVGYDTTFGYGRADALRMYDQFHAPVWVLQTLDGSANSGWYTSQKLKNGYPGIASVTGPGGIVKYSWQDDSGWHGETAYSNTYPALYTSLAYNNGFPAIGFHQSGSYFDYIYYSWKDAGGWHTEQVNQLDLTSGHGTSLAFNSGYPSISYSDGINNVLYYAYKDGSGWHNQGVSSETVYPFTSLGFNNGYPGISYSGMTSGGLAKVERNVSEDELKKLYSRFESIPLSDPKYNSLKQSMLSATHSYLKYAWRDVSGWHIDIVDANPNPYMYEGDYSSLTYYNGYPRISYREYIDGPDTHLKYAWKDASGWHNEMVDTQGAVGSWTSLAIDGTGNPHISYYDNTNNRVKHAWKDTGGWHNEVADSSGGQYTSMVLDSTGNHPRISYSNGNLRYAYK